MSYARQMLDTYPGAFSVDAGVLAAAIDALSGCVQACNADNAADLGEQNVTEMVRCIRLCLDCAGICTARHRGGHQPPDGVPRRCHPAAAAGLRVAICRSCGDECERHARMHEHCRVCTGAFRRCEQACRELLDAMK
jgi:hypothetical protein